MKKIFLLVATTSLIFATSACTSKKVDEAPDATAEMTGETTDDMAGVTEEDAPAAEKGATAEGETANAAPAEGSGDFNEEDFGSEDVAEAPSDKAAPAEGATKDEAAADSGEPPAEGADLAESTEAPPEGLAANDATSTETPSEAPAETTDSGSSLPKDEMNGLSGDAPVAKASIPLRKIETTPWTQNGILLNAVYLARPGDTFKSVSQKVYGDESKVKDLKKANPSIASRSMKVGDKVYYNSPKRPTDNTILLTYYEDNSLAPETYVSQPGDNIRAVSTKLLGDAQSWKEVWATNADVESKGELAEGTRLRYWAGEAAAAPTPDQTMAQNAPPPADKPQDQAAAGAVAGGAMPPPTDQAPPPMPEEVNGQQASPPPPAEEVAPPEPAVAEAPPPPPAEVAAAGAAPAAATSNPLGDMLGGEDQTTALMVGALLLIAAAALFIVIRKRKSRKNIDFQTATHTQIE